MKKRFMVVVNGWVYKTQLTAKSAVAVERQLNGVVNEVRIIPMPGLIG